MSTLPPITETAVKEALQALPKNGPAPNPFPLQDLRWVRREMQKEGTYDQEGVKTAVRALLKQALSRLAEVTPREAAILQARYLEGKSIKETQRDVDPSLDTIKKALDKMSDPLKEIIEQMEGEATAEYLQKIKDGVRSTHYDKRVGTADLPHQLAERLRTTHQPLVITGIGGLGKTTLAEAIIQHAMLGNHYHALLRIHVDDGQLNKDKFRNKLVEAMGIERQSEWAEPYEQARQRLKAMPHLVLLDNLETDIGDWAGDLVELSTPSHFVVTVREQPTVRTGLYEHALRELTAVEAAELVRQEAIHQQLPLAEATEEVVQSIYDVVGGNPLALILVVGLSRQASVAEVLADVRQAGQHNIRAMYQRIYANVWRSLKDEEQAILQVFAYFDMATRPEFVAAVQSEMPHIPELDVKDAIAGLMQRSLLQAHGSPASSHYYYSVHNLTKTFVQQDVMGWL